MGREGLWRAVKGRAGPWKAVKGENKEEKMMKLSLFRSCFLRTQKQKIQTDFLATCGISHLRHKQEHISLGITDVFPVTGGRKPCMT